MMLNGFGLTVKHALGAPLSHTQGEKRDQTTYKAVFVRSDGIS